MPTTVHFSEFLANTAAARIAQAATQYGRSRDPNAIAPLVNALSPERLDLMVPQTSMYQAWASPIGRFLSTWGMYLWAPPPTDNRWPLYPGCGYLRSCIWALGEIGIEQPLGDEAEQVLLDCAKHDNQFIRMEAYIALTKMGSKQCGPVFIDRLAQVFRHGPSAVFPDMDVQIAMGEMDILAEWIWQFGTTEQKDTLIGLLREQAAALPPDTWYHASTDRQMWDVISYGHWPTWIVWRAACTEDPRLLPALAERSASLPTNASNYQREFLRRAQAACGDSELAAMIVQQIVGDTNDAVQTSLGGTHGHASLDSLYQYSREPVSLRVAILGKRGIRNDLYPIPLEASDRLVRSAMSWEALSDWHVLHMLARVRRPQPKDRAALMQVWDKQDEPMQLLAADVLYVWGDVQTLTELYSLVEFPAVKAEVAWALAELEIPEAALIVEEQVHVSWNPKWLSLGRTFIHLSTDGRYRTTKPSYLSADMWRAEGTLWYYFHPTSGVLDDERLAVLKRIAADGTIHAGMRFDLLGKDYGGTEWGLPLLEQAARDILAVDSSPPTVQRIMSMMNSVGNGTFAVWP